VLLPALLASVDVKVLPEGFVGSLLQPISRHSRVAPCLCLCVPHARLCNGLSSAWCRRRRSSSQRLVAGGYGRFYSAAATWSLALADTGSLLRSGYLVAGGFRVFYFAMTTWLLADLPVDALPPWLTHHLLVTIVRMYFFSFAGIVGWCVEAGVPLSCILAVCLCLWDSAGNPRITCESSVFVLRPFFFCLFS
jgi:hypothetical protein